MSRHPAAARKAFSLMEIATSMAIVAVLLALLIPVLTKARSAGHAAVSQANLRQIATAWNAYMIDHEQFPTPDFGGGRLPEWTYGGVEFVGRDNTVALLPQARPINSYLGVATGSESTARAAEIFHSPADRGFTSIAGRTPLVVKSFYNTFGTSYIANPELVDPDRTGRVAPLTSLARTRPEALRLHEVEVSHSRLVLLGEPEWFYASRDSNHRATWWGTPGLANVALLDSSVTFTTFPDAIASGRLTDVPFRR